MGRFDRSGRTFAPAGIIWSVVMLSPVFRSTRPEISVPGFGALASGAIFGPRTMDTFWASSGGKGLIIRLSSELYLFGIFTLTGGIFSLRGSVIVPLIAAAAQVSGDARMTLADFVPERPSKFLLNDRTVTPPVGGANPMPMHGPQPDSSIRAPAFIMDDSPPDSVIMDSTCREPGEMPSETVGATVLPCSIAATVERSL